MNTSFSQELPLLQLAVDSTSLGEFKTCPRKYQLSIQQGWQTRDQSPHLTFGILMHQVREHYDAGRMEGKGHEETLDLTLAWALEATWDKELDRPWQSFHPEKNRRSLLQILVWYCDAVAKNDPIKTLQLLNGKPATELSFRFDSGYTAGNGEKFLLCGHLDRIGEISGQNYVVDLKTSTSQLSPRWFQQFSPHNQFSLYALAAKVAFGFKVSGVIVDGIQVGAGFARFQRGPIQRSEAILDEWYEDLGHWLKIMELSALTGKYPQNDKACDMYGGCVFRDVCSRSPGKARELSLSSHFIQRTWDPLIPR